VLARALQEIEFWRTKYESLTTLKGLIDEEKLLQVKRSI